MQDIQVYVMSKYDQEPNSFALFKYLDQSVKRARERLETELSKMQFRFEFCVFARMP